MSKKKGNKKQNGKKAPAAKKMNSVKAASSSSNEEGFIITNSSTPLLIQVTFRTKQTTPRFDYLNKTDLLPSSHSIKQYSSFADVVSIIDEVVNH